MRRVGLALTLCVALAACGQIAPDAHAPDFARLGYAPFSRQDAVAIALREWRLFGEKVNDSQDAPASDVGENKPERLPGLWQRVGEYWFEGVNAADPEHGWTGKHDGTGTVFPPERDGDYAWSAAFISYVMRIAGAGPAFPYSASHSHYINIAARMARHEATGWSVRAADPAITAPAPGDLLCNGREAARQLHFAQLPAGRYTAHCDIVVGDVGPSWAVIGGNVDDAVTLRHVPHGPDGRVRDGGSYLAVVQVLYAR